MSSDSSSETDTSPAFKDLGLSRPIIQALEEQRYKSPSPIQAQAIPAVLQGRDVMAAAQTGTGKTAGFVLPILELLKDNHQASANQVHALIVTPTRELAAQVHTNVKNYGRHLKLKTAEVYGGVSINPQMMKMRRGVDILVATPGRLLDLHQQNAIRLDQVKILVLDEADRMLDMGFIHDIRRIIKAMPPKRQNLMFSATFSDDIRKLAAKIVQDPIEISVSPANTTVDSVEHWIHPVDKKQKSPLLIHLIQQGDWQQVLVFSRTKHGANKLAKQLNAANISAAAIHGNKSQGARTKALKDFKAGNVRVLVATDIAARGIDISSLPHVVNFDLPNVPEDYVHRIGRTGRAGESGKAISLVCADEHKQLSDIEHFIKQLLEREYIEGFDPVHDVPLTSLDKRVKKHKPKNPKEGHRDGQRSAKNSDGPKPKRRRRRSGKKAGAQGGNKSGQGRNRNRNRNKKSGSGRGGTG
ncbi:MAG: DEAD/DEAH box helicase [Gammaproteobacteria bacterium]|nr:DEAD/DEAH box helicase [Gammaproteobacteria bacterium]